MPTKPDRSQSAEKFRANPYLGPVHMRIILDGYTIEKEIYHSSRTLVFSAFRKKERRSFAVKTLSRSHRIPREIARLLREYEIAMRLQEISGVIRMVALEKFGREIPAIIMEKAQSSLRDRLKIAIPSLEERIDIAIRMTRILGEIHRCNVIHKDIHPGNILCMDSPLDLRLIDFGISAAHPREKEGFIGSSHQIVGALPYISPEQTGRMNRDIDYRSDYYSLGVTLYEIFTGALPFRARENGEWIYCHIATPPRDPLSVDRTLPKALSPVLMKLLAKDPENRYQSAQGIIEDLDACRDCLRKKDFRTIFSPGRFDISERLNISEKLYGREEEIGRLKQVIDGAMSAPPPVVVIFGEPGIGKTTLVRELQRLRRGLPGYFIGGRFDPGRKDLPYSAITQAFNQLVRQLLAEPPERLSFLREEIGRATGPDIHLILQIIPELEKIIPRQEVPQQRIDLRPSEAQNRFKILFQDFIRIFAGKDHPLVLFLDDLQWCDGASLGLLESLLAGEGPGHLLLILAYRSREVDQNHPAALALKQIETRKPILRIPLAPLHPDAVHQWLTASLQSDPKHCRLLSEILRKKTGANPFFLHELLHHLYRESLLRYDFLQGRGRWVWDAAAVQQVDVTGNIAAYLIESLQKLPFPALEAVKRAACIGSSFDLDGLAFLLELSPEKILQDLESAIEIGILTPVYENSSSSGSSSDQLTFRFQHERLQQAAGKILASAEKEQIHLRLGRRLLEAEAGEKGAENIEENLFEIVHHLNRGRSGITASEERERLARLNLKAAILARETIAYAPALNHLKIGLELLGTDAWDRQYELAAALGLEVIRCAFPAGAAPMAQAHIDLLLEKMKTALEKAEVRYLQSIQYTVAGRMEAGMASGIAGLQLLGIGFSHPSAGLFRKLTLIREIFSVRWNLGFREIEDLIHSPSLTDPKKRMAIRLLEAIGSLAYFMGDQYKFMLTILKMANISLRYGISRESALAYAYYGLLLSVMGKHKHAQLFGKLAIAVNEHLKDLQFRCRILCVHAISIHHWKAHWESLTPLFDRAIEAGYRSGDFLSLGHSAIHAVIWNPKIDLETKLEKMAPYLALVRRIGYPDALDSILLARQMNLNLLGRTAGPLSLNDASFSESDCLEGMEKRRYRSGLARYHFHKAEIAYFHEEYLSALDQIREGDKVILSVQGTPTTQRYAFIAFLVHAACYRQLPLPEQKRAVKRMQKEYAKMKRLAAFSWVNFMHLQKIMGAEYHRLFGGFMDAEIRYHQAIRSAQINGWMGDEALANELCGRFYSGTFREKNAGLCFQEAHSLYQRWGARIKARLIEEKEGWRFTAMIRPQSGSAPLFPRSSSPTTEEIDLDTMMKVSQTISAEFRLENLLRHLMESLIQNSGAQKGMLILNENGKLLIKAEKAEGETEIRVMNFLPVESSDRLSIAVVRYVINSRKSLILNDAAGDGSFADTDYIQKHRPKSILCSPLHHQNRLLGLLYLENNAATHVFTRERIRILNLLMSQAAISIENGRMYQQIEASERKYRSLYERAVEGIYQTGLDGRFISGNPSLYRISGFDSFEDVPENIISMYVDPNDRHLFVRMLKQEGRISAFETRLKQKDGSMIWVSLSAVLVNDPDGEPMIEGSMVDITERMEKEKAQQERIAAQKANLAKSEFLAVMSHEIRTPMNAIIALTDLTLKSELTAKQQKHLETIKISAHSLLNILNDILDYSKIEAGKLDMSETDFRLDLILSEIESMFKTRISGTNLCLTLSLSEDTPIALIGDPLRLKQILVNLLGNAFKFTRKGEIILHVEPVAAEEKEGEGAVKLQFSVRDTGIGISEERIKHLFLPFAQADLSITREYGGTGLGLSITRKLVEMMGGTIWAKSRPDQGSTFFFTALFRPSLQKESSFFDSPLPRNRSGGSRAKAIDCRDKNIRILLAEDNPINQQIIIEILSDVGITVDTAPDGQEALKQITQKAYHAVLMDVQMPVLDGLEATRIIRTDPAFAEIPIIAMTAHAMKEDRQRCLESGMNDYITKPIDIDLLFATLARWIPEMVPPRPAAAEPVHSAEPEPLPGIDMASAMERFGENISLLHRLVAKFREEFKGAAQNLQEMIQKGEIDAAAGYCHQIKGVAANLSAIKLSDAARDLEMAVKNGNSDGVEPLLKAFEAALEEVTDMAGQIGSTAE